MPKDTTMTTTDTPQRRRHSRLDPRTSMALARTEHARTIDALRALGPDDWSRPTSCPDWDVRQLACHMVGMAEFPSSPVEIARQQRKAGAVHARRGGQAVDALTQVQVEERADWTPEQVVAGAQRAAVRGARGRRLISAVAARAPLPGSQLVNGREESWSVGYLLRTILTRDPWMHRTDLAAATGRPMTLTPDHDGVIVDDVVAEWAERHGRPYQLELTGPAGGSWRQGDAELVTLDAVEFCRIISGRGTGVGLLETQVPF
jgi:uncharacterized protein (TIGR03083 family)